MTVRKIKDSELKRTSELFGVAFEFEINSEKSNEETVNEVKNNPKSRGDLYYGEKWAAFDKDENMMAFISTTPYNAQFDGHVVKMTGIGAVSTLPQYRRHGAIRQCFNESLKDMYNNDFTLSYLYPFSTGYYNKFGYELCGEVMHYYINLSSIKRFEEADGQTYLVEHGNYLEDVKKVYNDYAEGYNLMCVHDDIDYNNIKESNPAKDGHYIYVYKDKNGVAKGVIAFRKVKNSYRFDMQCSMFYFSDMEGFKGLLNHTLAYSSYYDHVIIKLPLNINITSYIPEWALYSYKRECYFNGMVRVVNVKKALELAKYKGDGELAIEIEDKQIEQNNGTFKVTFENDKAMSIEQVSDKADISMSINDFSRLLIGTHSSEEFKYIEKLKINSDLDKIGKVFYKKLNFIADYF